jgi:hypothetical protein
MAQSGTYSGLIAFQNTLKRLRAKAGVLLEER